MSINQYSSDIGGKTPWWSTQQQQQGMIMEASIIEKSSSSSGAGIEASWARQAELYNQQAQQPRGLLVSRGLNLNKEELEELEAEAEEDENNNNGSCSRSEEEEEEEERGEEGGKERMFEKALTPSDVGKLNRLVIPKQHAEKHFPLSDSGGENKGVLLSFEDESGRCWRFRYSYWNSSQSYVLTKGWSRYVKDKRLHAGDVVSFLRHPSLPHRLFIAWRRRPHNHLLTTRPMAVPPHHATTTTSDNIINTNKGSEGSVGLGVGVGWTTTPFYTPHPYPAHPHPFPFPPHQTLHAPGLPLPLTLTLLSFFFPIYIYHPIYKLIFVCHIII